MKPNDIYLATVGIEVNRWTKGRESTIDLVEWLPRIARAGFDGVELWEHHASRLAPDELARAAAVAKECGCPVPIFNTYVKTAPGDEHVAHRRADDAVAKAFGSVAYKFNVSGDSHADAVAFAREWAAETNVLFLCECHGGTMMEDPATAASVLRELGVDRFAAILHTLIAGDEAFERDLEHKGDLLRHVHVQNLDQHTDLVAERVAMLRELGRELTWSIEFTSPVREKGDAEACFAQSVEDMRFLRSCLQ